MKRLFPILLSSIVLVACGGGAEALKSRAGSRAAGQEEGENIDVSKIQKPGECSIMYPWGSPQIETEEVDKRSLWMCYEGFALQYDPVAKIPLWSTEVLSRRNIEYEPYPNEFKLSLDPNVPKSMQMQAEDYLHAKTYLPVPLAAVSNMSFHDEFKSQETIDEINLRALNQSQFLTNTVPMVREGLADHLWPELEDYVRQVAVQKGNIYVTTGAIYFGGHARAIMSQSKALVPTHYYKTLVDPITYGAVSYILPNKPIYTSKTKNKTQDMHTCSGGPCSISNFVVPLKEVERLAAIRLYTSLSDYQAAQVRLDAGEMIKKDEGKKGRKKRFHVPS